MKVYLGHQYSSVVDITFFSWPLCPRNEGGGNSISARGLSCKRDLSLGFEINKFAKKWMAAKM